MDKYPSIPKFPFSPKKTMAMKRLSSCELLHKLKNGLEVPTNPEVGKKTTVTLVKSERQ